jgi:hypothetical protein
VSIPPRDQAATDTDQDNCQELPDFEQPRSFDLLVNELHYMSVSDAHKAVTYEGMYTFLQGLRSLRFKLRPIHQSLCKVKPLKLSSDEMTLEARRAEAWSLLREGFPPIRQAYDRLLVFAESVAAAVSSLNEEKSRVPNDLLKRWESSDERAMKKMIVELFEAGMTKDDERFLDRTHYTQHFLNMRALINSVPGEEFCQKMEHFGRGIQETRDALEFK